MAKVNPIRRAEIGREKRARTRAQLLVAATELFAGQAVESVTVDDVVRVAGVAKGTFYVHFDGLGSLTSAVADELVRTFDELLQARRLALADPAARIAFGCGSFIDKALADPRWASLVARMAASTAMADQIALRRLFEDLVRLPILRGGMSAELKLEVVTGIMLQLMRAIGEGKLSPLDRDAAVAAILRSIGCDDRQVDTALEALSLPAVGTLPAPTDRDDAGQTA